MRLFLVLLFFPFFLPSVSAQEKSPPLRTVVKVLDGGTLVLNGREVVRLIGVQAPKSKEGAKPNSAVMGWWRRSKDFTESLVKNRKVWLEYGQVRQDEAGNTWAYVFFKVEQGKSLGVPGASFLATAGTFLLNRLIIRYGMANSGNPFSFKYRSQFKQMERDARNSQIGLFQQAF